MYILQYVAASLQARPETPKEEYICLDHTEKKIGPEGGKIEVVPETWIVIDKNTFSSPTIVKVQVTTKS